MQQQREQQQQQQQCLAGYLQRPEDAPGEAMRGKQPQQRPTGHINFPHRPQHTHTRQGALDAPLEACEQKGAHSRGVRFGRRLSASGQHLIRRRGRCNAGGRWHSRCTAARCTLRSIIKLLRDLLTSRKAITTQSNKTATMLPARIMKANDYYSLLRRKTVKNHLPVIQTYITYIP